MSMINTTPPRRAHAFINHSPETYEAELKRQQPSVKKEASAGSPQANRVPPNPKSPTRDSSESTHGIYASSQTEPHTGSRLDHQLRDGASSQISNQSRHSIVSSSKSDTMPHKSELLSQIYSDPSPSPDDSSDSSQQGTQQSCGEASSPSESNGGAHKESQVSAAHSESSTVSNSQLREAPRKRRRTSPNELHILETEFARNSKPCKDDRERIANLTSMDEKAVQVWFQNKRQSCRRQQSQGHIITPAILRTHSMPLGLQDENTFQTGIPFDQARKAIFDVQNPVATAIPMGVQPPLSAMQAKRAKSLKLSMSADGKAELIERSPLKQLHSNGSNALAVGHGAPPAMRFATMPVLTPQLSGFEQECASSLLVLKSGQWR